MAIEERKFFVVECDYCNELLDDFGEGFSVYTSKKDAENALNSADWDIKNNEIICNHCMQNRQLNSQLDLKASA